MTEKINTVEIIILVVVIIILIIALSGGFYYYKEVKEMSAKYGIDKTREISNHPGYSKNKITDSKPPVNKQNQNWDNLSSQNWIGEATNYNSQDIVGTRMNYTLSEGLAGLSENNHGMGEECSTSSQCSEGLQCNPSMIYRVKDGTASIQSDLSNRTLVPFIDDYLRDKSVIDVIYFDNSLIALMKNGDFYIRNDKDPFIVNSNGHKFTGMAIANDTIYTLSQTKIYKLNMNDYMNNRNWIWTPIKDLEGIVSIESPHDGSFLHAVSPSYSYAIVDGIIKNVVKSNGLRIFGNTAERYALFNGDNRAILNPSGNIVENIAGIAINEQNKVYTYPNRNRNKAKISHMRTFMGEPIFISEQICMPSLNTEIIL